MGLQRQLDLIQQVCLFQDLRITFVYELTTSRLRLKVDRNARGANSTARFIWTDVPLFDNRILFDLVLDVLAELMVY